VNKEFEEHFTKRQLVARELADSIFGKDFCKKQDERLKGKGIL